MTIQTAKKSTLKGKCYKTSIYCFISLLELNELISPQNIVVIGAGKTSSDNRFKTAIIIDHLQ